LSPSRNNNDLRSGLDGAKIAECHPTLIANQLESPGRELFSWAHSAIYSNRRDFVFARRVFSENPQYRNVPKTMVAPLATQPATDAKAG
jgi:hypothetical protein